MSFEKFLESQGYTGIRKIRLPGKDGVRYAALYQFAFTGAIITGCWGDTASYEDRWCYESLADAEAALNRWDPVREVEPDGWHRHPLTGRRRDHGDPGLEKIMF